MKAEYNHRFHITIHIQVSSDKTYGDYHSGHGGGSGSSCGLVGSPWGSLVRFRLPIPDEEDDEERGVDGGCGNSDDETERGSVRNSSFRPDSSKGSSSFTQVLFEAEKNYVRTVVVSSFRCDLSFFAHDSTASLTPHNTNTSKQGPPDLLYVGIYQKRPLLLGDVHLGDVEVGGYFIISSFSTFVSE